MTALYVILAIVLIFWLIGLIRLRGVAEYSEEGFLLQVRILWFKITIYPDLLTKGKEKKPKPQKPPKPKPEKPEKPKDTTPLPEKIGGLWSLFQDILPHVTSALGKLRRKLRVDELILHLTWATPDPAKTAMGYGAGNAALGMVLPLLERTFDIRERDVGVAVDFRRTEPIIYARGMLSYTIGQLVSIGVVLAVSAGIKLLKYYLANRSKKKKAAPKQGQKELVAEERKEGALQ